MEKLTYCLQLHPTSAAATENDDLLLLRVPEFDMAVRESLESLLYCMSRSEASLLRVHEELHDMYFAGGHMWVKGSVKRTRCTERERLFNDYEVNQSRLKGPHWLAKYISYRKPFKMSIIQKSHI